MNQSSVADRVILSIDLGTSGPKVALVSPYGEVLASEREETPLLLLAGGGAEQRPDDWWQAITKAVRNLVAQRTVSVDNIAAISCTSQYSSTVAVGKDGWPLSNAINWMDTRGAHYIREITHGLIRVQGYGIGKLLTWIRRTGGAPAQSGKDSIAHILYIKNEMPAIYRDTFKFLEPKDYINFRLTGRLASTFDAINLHWVTDNRNVDNIHYDSCLLELTGVDGNKLPDLVRPTDILGHLQSAPAAELGLPAGLPVVAGTTDAQSAAIGSGAVKDYEPHLYLGTSSWLSAFVPFKKTDIFHNMASLPSAIPGRYYIANEQECAGACLAWLRDCLVYPADELSAGTCPSHVYATFDRVAEKVPAGSDGLIFTPWMYGERSPIEDHSVRGAFFNMTLKTKRENLIRAVLEGVAYNSRWLLVCVERFCRRRMDDIHMIGGGAHSDVWCQIYADVLDRSIVQMTDPLQANTRGAGLVGSIALGYIQFDDIAKRVTVAKTYRPNTAHRKVYDELFREFLNIYMKNKRIYARLNG
jgi:xylulokinase